MQIHRASSREGQVVLVRRPPLNAHREDGESAFVREQLILARFNAERIAPGLGEPATLSDLARETNTLLIEGAFIERQRRAVASRAEEAPPDPEGFVSWFNALRETGPGQNDPLFPWLAEEASHDQMRWFLAQEIAGEAGFEDLVALTQLKMPVRPKLEMARNYWDEMGRGQEKGMHGPMLERLAQHFEIGRDSYDIVPESMALANTMSALAFNRRYAFLSIGALGVIELTAPGRAALVSQGLKRLGVPAKARHYFALHAVLDVRHAEAWNAEVIAQLVAEDPRRAPLIAEGALMRLENGKACFERYRREFGLAASPSPLTAGVCS